MTAWLGLAASTSSDGTFTEKQITGQSNVTAKKETVSDRSSPELEKKTPDPNFNGSGARNYYTSQVNLTTTVIVSASQSTLTRSGRAANPPDRLFYMAQPAHVDDFPSFGFFTDVDGSAVLTAVLFGL